MAESFMLGTRAVRAPPRPTKWSVLTTLSEGGCVMWSSVSASIRGSEGIIVKGGQTAPGAAPFAPKLRITARTLCGATASVWVDGHVGVLARRGAVHIEVESAWRRFPLPAADGRADVVVLTIMQHELEDAGARFESEAFFTDWIAFDAGAGILLRPPGATECKVDLERAYRRLDPGLTPAGVLSPLLWQAPGAGVTWLAPPPPPPPLVSALVEWRIE